MKELQAITERLARHQKDHPVGPKSDIELVMAYIATLHERIAELEEKAASEAFHHSGDPSSFEIQAYEDTRAGYAPPANITLDTLAGDDDDPVGVLACSPEFRASFEDSWRREEHRRQVAEEALTSDMVTFTETQREKKRSPQGTEGDILHLLYNVKREDVDPDHGFVAYDNLQDFYRAATGLPLETQTQEELEEILKKRLESREAANQRLLELRTQWQEENKLVGED